MLKVPTFLDGVTGSSSSSLFILYYILFIEHKTILNKNVLLNNNKCSFSLNIYWTNIYCKRSPVEPQVTSYARLLKSRCLLWFHSIRILLNTRLFWACDNLSTKRGYSFDDATFFTTTSPSSLRETTACRVQDLELSTDTNACGHPHQSSKIRDSNWLWRWTVRGGMCTGDVCSISIWYWRQRHHYQVQHLEADQHKEPSRARTSEHEDGAGRQKLLAIRRAGTDESVTGRGRLRAHHLGSKHRVWRNSRSGLYAQVWTADCAFRWSI